MGRPIYAYFIDYEIVIVRPQCEAYRITVTLCSCRKTQEIVLCGYSLPHYGQILCCIYCSPTELNSFVNRKKRMSMAYG